MVRVVDAARGDPAIDSLRLAEDVLGQALQAGASEAEVLVTGDDSYLTRFANSEIHQNVAETNGSLNLRVAIGKRIGVASSNRLDDEGLRRLAETASAIARNSASGDTTPLPPPASTYSTTTPNRTPPSTSTISQPAKSRPCSLSTSVPRACTT